MPLITMTLTAHNALNLDELLAWFYKEEEVRKDNIVNMTFQSRQDVWVCHLTYFAVRDLNVHALHDKYDYNAIEGVEEAKKRIKDLEDLD